MATPQKKELDISVGPDTEELSDGEDVIEEPDADTEETETLVSKEKTGKSQRSLFKRKWVILIILLSIIGGIVGIGYRFGPEYVPGWPKKSAVVFTGEDQVDMREEPMAPFFIPLPPGSFKEVVRVDFSIISDGLASLQYFEKEVQARDRLYKYLADKAKKDPNLNTQLSLLETEMAGILRDLLGVNSVLIRVKEVKVF
jgi:hypothetical protein